MDIEKSGSLAEKTPVEVFGAIYRTHASGVIYFKGPDGKNAFAIVNGGRVEHASGEVGAGDAALKTVLSWRDGEYRFIEDVKADMGEFPPNLSPAVAALAVGAEAPPGKPVEPIPPLPVLPVGEAEGKAAAISPVVLYKEMELAAFTGVCALGGAGSARGMFLFINGKATGGLAWDGKRFLYGKQAEAVLGGIAEEERSGCLKLRLGPEAAAAVGAGLAGAPTIARLPAAVLNIDEFLAWAAETRATALLSIVAEKRAANILIFHGKVLGAVVAPQTALVATVDDALALLYTPGATVEVFTAAL